MARLAKNAALKGIKGTLGKQLVFKQYGDKTVITLYPDMSRVKPSPKQKRNRNLFKEAVAYAKNINRTPALKQAYLKKVKKGENVYHYAIKEYLQKHKQNA
jgi:hypothetical protein